jgi:hypothetical protein
MVDFLMINGTDGTCSYNAIRGFIKSFLIVYSVKYGMSFVPALLTGAIFRQYILAIDSY